MEKVDFWDSLPKAQQEEILIGIEEADNDETVSYEEFIEEHR